MRSRRTGHTCSAGMDRAGYYRERAKHFRQLAELTWQDGLETMLRGLAEEYEHLAASMERGAEREKPQRDDHRSENKEPRSGIT